MALVYISKSLNLNICLIHLFYLQKWCEKIEIMLKKQFFPFKHTLASYIFIWKPLSIRVTHFAILSGV